MDFVGPREPRADFIALCREWRKEHRALADDLLARWIVHTELIGGEWRDVTMCDADRHARIATELESLLAEFAKA
jgi:hypothetical protein